MTSISLNKKVNKRGHIQKYIFYWEDCVESRLSNGDVVEILSVDLVINVSKLDNIVKLDFFVVILSNLEFDAASVITDSALVGFLGMLAVGVSFSKALHFKDLKD